MSLTAATAASTAAEIWRSIGLELMIFVVTLIFALIIRSTGKKVPGKGSQSKKDVSDAGSPTSVERSPAQNHPAQVGSRGGLSGTFAERSADRYSERRWGQPKDAIQIIDEVVSSMREMPGTKSANKALALYADLQSRTKEININKAAHHARYSGIEFYTTLVQCAIRIGKHHLVEGLLDDMSRQNVARSLAFYESAMKQLAGQKHYHLALSMYDRLVSDGFEATAVTYSCLISFAAEVGELQRAIGFFEKLSSTSTPSIRAYMTVLRVHAKRQDWPSSLSVFRQMQQKKVLVDSLVLNVILATGVAADQIEGIEELLDEADAMKPPISDVVSYNTLIKGYAHRNDALKAIQVLQRMRKRGLSTNAITFNTTMDAAVRSMRTQEAWDLLKDMRSSGFRPDKFTCSILIKGLGKNPKAEDVRTSLELLHEVDNSCDATLRSTLYHSVLEAAGQVPDTAVLMETFTQMRKHHVVLTASAYRLLVQAFGQEGDASRCSQIWHQMLSEDIRPQASIFIALLECHLQKGQVNGALEAFDCLRSKIKEDAASNRLDSSALVEECRVAFIRSLCRISREPEATHLYIQARADGSLANIDSATGMMLARVQADSGNLGHSWTTLEDMMGLGHKPNEATLLCFLNACVKQSHTVYAKALFNAAGTKGIALSQATYALFLKLYGRCQQLGDAMAVYELMTEKQHIEPAPQTLIALLRVCFQCRQPGKAMEIMEKLQAKAGSAPLDGTIYRTAISGLASANLVPKGVALAEQAAESGASLPDDALEVLAQAAERRGQAGASELQRLRQVAEKLKIQLPAQGATTLGSKGNVATH